MPFIRGTIDSKGPDQLKILIADFTGLNAAEVPQDVIFDDLGLDSLQALELAEKLKHDFRVEIPSHDLTVTTLGDVLRKLNGIPTKLETLSTSNVALPVSTLQDAGEQNLLDIIAQAAGLPVKKIENAHSLGQLLDELAILELEQDIEDSFPSMRNKQLTADMTIESLVRLLGIKTSKSPEPTQSSTKTSETNTTTISPSPFNLPQTPRLPNPLTALSRADANFPVAAQTRGFTNYWAEVAPLYNELLLAYVIEGSRTLGVDLSTVPSGSVIPSVSYLPKYERLFSRLWKVFERAGIVLQNRNGKLIRGNTPLDVNPSSQLNAELKANFPAYDPELQLLNLVGPNLGAVVVGQENAVSLMFGTLSSLQIMEEFYTNSPMMATLTDQLLHFFTILLRDTKILQESPIKILEVGAGTGGTTTRLVELLDTLDVQVEYTFTDISTAFVSRAKRKFQKYKWLRTSVLNLETPIPDSFKSAFDIVVGANVVHATTDRVDTCSRLRETLRDGGILVLSEITRVIDWYDIVFGLLDGWWLAEGGRGYPIQSARKWMEVFRKAGFGECGFSGSSGGEAEAESQQLLVGWK